MRRGWCVAIVCVATGAGSLVATATPAHAEPKPDATEAAQEPAEDAVYLRNGGVYHGRIAELVPEDHVTIITVGGRRRRASWDEIARVEVSGDTPAPIVEQPPTKPDVTPGTPPDLDKPPGPAKPTMQRRANRTAITAGAVMFGVGYAPVVIAGAPSAVGLVGRVVILVFTVGLPCSFGSTSSYLCKGQHGAVQLLLPFAGPFTFAADHPRDTVLNKTGSELSVVTKGLLYASGGLQIAGFGAILTGLILTKEEATGPPAPSGRKDKPSFYVGPIDVPNAVGISAGVYNW